MTDPINPATSLTRAQVLRQRSRRLRRLSRVYSDYYWSLIEELKAKHREFVWRYGSSPSRDQLNNEDAADEENVVNGDEEGIMRCKANGCKSKAMALTRFCLLHILMDNNQVLYKGCAYKMKRYGCSPSREVNNEDGEGSGGDVVVGDERMLRCKANGCKSKAMALTRFCLVHIWMDNNQVLYKGCAYKMKSSPSGPVSCMKPIIRSAVPSLCPVHLDKAEKTMKAALKKAGYNNTTTANKVAPKCNVLIAEAVRQIQSKRRVAKRAHLDDKSEAKDDC